jgi:hypothetical protein
VYRPKPDRAAKAASSALLLARPALTVRDAIVVRSGFTVEDG